MSRTLCGHYFQIVSALASPPLLLGYRVVCFVVWLTAPNAVVAKKSFS